MTEYVESVSDSNGASFLAIGGTLLGSVRSGKIIKWDDDIDLCVLTQDLEALESIDYAAYGLVIDRRKDGWLYKVRLEGTGRPAFVDIFPFRHNSDAGRYEYDSETARARWPNGWFHDSEVFPLEQRRFETVFLKQPRSPVSYLERHYGEDWKTPKRTHVHHRVQRYVEVYPVIQPVAITVTVLLSLSIFFFVHRQMDNPTWFPAVVSQVADREPEWAYLHSTTANTHTRE